MFYWPFTAGYDILDSMNVIQSLIPALRRMRPRTAQENRWHPRLSGIFKEHRRRANQPNYSASGDLNPSTLAFLSRYINI